MFSLILKNVCKAKPLYQSNKLVCAVINAKAFSSEIEKSQAAQRNKAMETIFDKILNKEIAADVIYEDEQCLAFNDVAPQAPTHFLVIPKRRIPMLDDCVEDDKMLLGMLLFTASRLAKERLPEGYRVVINNGVQGCQSIYHLHIHVIGGKQLGWPPG